MREILLLEGDFALNSENNRNKNILVKEMDANNIYEHIKGTIVMEKRNKFFKINGSGFSENASIGTHTFF